MSAQEKTIQIILQDLYRIDPSLKEHEEELIQVITQLIKSKPQAKLDEKFRMELREQILKMARDINLHTKFGKSKFAWADAFMGQFLKPAGLVVAGIVLAAIVAVPLILKQDGGVEKLENPFALKMTQTSDRAFGSLLAEQQQAPEAEALGRGGGGPVSAAREISVEEVLDAAPSAMPMPALYRVNYNYVYKGDDFTIEQDKMPVFQKVKDSKAASAVGEYLGGIDIGALDLSRFKDAKVEQFHIAEDRPNGYLVTVNFAEGAVSISQNWSRWSHDFEGQLTKSDIPKDDVMVDLADKFIREYEIDMSNYGEGEVSNEWMRSYGMEEMAGELYIPGNISVVYPLIIDGKEVTERSGYQSGLQVNIDIRQKKVAGLWGLSSQSYESSLYEVETDVDKILEVAQAGQRKFLFDNPTKTLEFELGTPKQALMRVYNYENGESKQFLAPCLIFPVTKAPDTAGYYQENIVVPLVKELLEQESVEAYPTPRAIPVIEPAPVPTAEVEVDTLGE